MKKLNTPVDRKAILHVLKAVDSSPRLSVMIGLYPRLGSLANCAGRAVVPEMLKLLDDRKQAIMPAAGGQEAKFGFFTPQTTRTMQCYHY